MLSVVWLASGTLLDNVEQPATSAPLNRRKAMAMWIPPAFSQQWQNEKFQAGSLKGDYRKVTVLQFRTKLKVMQEREENVLLKQMLKHRNTFHLAACHISLK